MIDEYVLPATDWAQKEISLSLAAVSVAPGHSSIWASSTSTTDNHIQKEPTMSMWFPSHQLHFMRILRLLLGSIALTGAFSAVTGVEDGTSTVVLPKLPLGDINIVILTDTHSWLGGHGQKEKYDLDYGDVLSFYQILKQRLEVLHASDPEKHKHDLFFVMNGDWIDGTGLALNGDPSYLMPLLEKMPWDAVNVGNHELYRGSVIDQIVRPGGFSQWWGRRYLSSNIVETKSLEPIGNKFTYMYGQHSTVLVFGFLYNMEGYDPKVTVKKVEEVITEGWFEEALMGTSVAFDAILVLAHMDHRDALIKVILDRIRLFVDSDMPVQFVTGHTHYRGYSKPDEHSLSFEAGRYLDTIGFVSFPTQTTVKAVAKAKEEAEEEAEKAAQEAAKEAAEATNTTDCLDGDDTVDCTGSNSTNEVPVPPTNPPPETDPSHSPKTPMNNDTFQFTFIDASYNALQTVLGEEIVATMDGLDLSLFIERVQFDLGLFRIVGCIEENHYLAKGLNEENSLWGLFCDHVVPHVFPWEPTATTHTGNPKVVLLDKGFWRYDLLAKELTLDEVIAVAPFNDSMSLFPGLPGSAITALNAALNENGAGTFLPDLPAWIMCPSPESPQPWDGDGADAQFDLVTDDFSLKQIRDTLQRVWTNSSNSPGSLPEAEPLPHHTPLTAWIDFFDKTNLCQTENKGKHKKKPSTHNHTPDDTTQKKKPKNEILGDAFQEGEKLDNERMDFIWIALITVLVLFGLHVRKRTRIFRSEVHARELASLQALEEYNEQQEARARYFDRDFFNSSSDNDNESGEFPFIT